MHRWIRAALFIFLCLLVVAGITRVQAAGSSKDKDAFHATSGHALNRLSADAHLARDADGEDYLHRIDDLSQTATSLSSARYQPLTNSFQHQVVELTNQERIQQGLTPLKRNSLLDQSATAHSQAMADDDFFSHDNPITSSEPSDRVTAVNYTWAHVGENIAAGQDTPEEVVEGWMNSPGHRANILDPDYQEIGVGYIFDTNDTFLCGGGSLPCFHYWTQNFGTARGSNPIIINNEDFVTNTPDVSLFLYGEDWAQEMRLKNDTGAFSEWEPFVSERSWQLDNAEGEHTVTVELRNGENVVSASDTIVLGQAQSATTQSAPESGSPENLPDPVAQQQPTNTPTTLPPAEPEVNQVAEGMTLERSVNPQQIVTDQEVTVELSLSSSVQCPVEEIPGRGPVDAILTLDNSGSMNYFANSTFIFGSGSTKLEQAIDAALAFVDQVDLSVDRVGVVTFDDNAVVVSELTNDETTLRSDISGIRSDGGTAIHEGLDTALDQLTGPQQRPETSKVIILLSDGDSHVPRARTASQAAKDAGVRIITIGLGSDADEDLLQEIASTNDNGQPEYYFSPDGSELSTIFGEVAQSIKPDTPVTDLTFEHTYDAANFELVAGSINPPAARTGPGTIVWNLSRLGDTPSTFTYRLEPRVPGTFDTAQGDTIAFTRCEAEQPEEVTTTSGLPVMVQAPTPTLTPTPSLTPTPDPTFTPVPPPLPGLPPPPPPTATDQVLSSFCGGFPWWLLLALLLIILFLILAWHFNLAGLRKWLREDRRWPRLCEIAGLLIPIYAIFLLALLLSQLSPLVCHPAEVVLFWQNDTGRATHLMRKPLDPDLPARSLRLFNANDFCELCDIAVSENGRIAAVDENKRIHIFDASGREIDIPELQGSYLSWAPNGQSLAFSANDEDILILDVATGSTAPLEGASEPGEIETMPAWSPDGQTILFVRPIRGDQGFQIDAPSSIYAVPFTGGSPAILSGAGGNGFNYRPAFSPDGRWVAFTHHTEGDSTNDADEAEIYIVPSRGGQQQRLQANFGENDQPLDAPSSSHPVWSSDGSLLYFESRRDRNQYDVFFTVIGDNGGSGPAQPFEDASDPDLAERIGTVYAPPAPDVLGAILGLWPWLLGFIPLFILAWICCLRPKPPEDTLKLEGSVSPQIGRVGRDEFTVRLKLIGLPEKCTRYQQRKPIDVVLVLDVSQSMEGKQLDDAKAAARAFVSALDMSQDRVSVVSFSDDALVVSPFDNQEGRLKTAIDSLKTQGGTSLHAGLDAARGVIVEQSQASDAAPIVLLLSDGGSDADAAEAAEAAASEVKDTGARLITIGLGEGVNSDLLQSLASQPSDYEYAPDSNRLAEIYRGLATSIRPLVAATDIEFEHRYDAEKFELVPGSVSPRKGTDLGEGIINWHIDHISSFERRFSYQLRPRQEGSFDIAQGNTISYVKCGSHPGEIHPVVPLLVTVRGRRIVQVPSPPETVPEPPEVMPPEVVWQPDKALLIGIGGTGRRVLTYVKKNLLDAGAGQISDDIRMMVLDTSEYEKVDGQQVLIDFAGVSIDNSEVVVLNENLSPLLQRMAKDSAAEPQLREFLPISDYNSLTDTSKNLASGTNARRPMARAGLIRQLQQMDERETTAQLWKLLVEAIDAVASKEEQSTRVRIILVGSLAGGMSGTLMDMAHLVRQVTQIRHGEGVETRIEGYLAMDTVFSDLAANPKTLAANTFGALRELRRFQLNPGVDYPMPVYQPDAPGGSAGAGSVSRDKPFTDLFFFGQRIDFSGNPSLSTFPAMADLITLRLDRASQGAGPADWRSSMRNEVDTYNNEQHELSIGTAGSFTYRLPAYDVMEDIKMRWVRSLLRTFLVGESAGDLVLDPQIVQDEVLLELSSDPAGLVPIFLEGDIREGVDSRNLEAASALLVLILNQIDDRLETGLSKLENQDQQVVRTAFEEELTYTLRLILSGSSRTEASKSRMGKLAYALTFLDTLVAQLGQVEVTIANMISSTDTDPRSRQQFRKLQDARSDYLEVAEASRNRLRQTSRAISRQMLNEAVGPDGLYDALEKRATQLQQWRKEMEAITVRKYFWKVREQSGTNEYVEYELADLWYQDYARGQQSPDRYVEHLVWEALSEGTLVLSLSVRENNVLVRKTLTSTDDVPEFMEALLNLAGAVLQDAWKAHSLSTVLKSHGLLERPDGQQTASNMRETAHPILDFESTKASNAYRQAMLCSTELLKSDATDVADNLKKVEIDAQNNSVGTVTELITTDPYSFQFVRTVDAIPLESINRLWEESSKQSACDHYMKDKERRVVFGAEVEAERWERERRIGRDGMGDLTLHPLVVAGLVNPERARSYALALASNIIQEDQAARTVSLQLPQQSRQHLLLPDKAPVSVDPLVMGLLVFSLQSPVGLEAEIAQLERLLAEPTAEMINQWRSTWGDSVPPAFRQGAPDRQDLGKWVRLVVRYELAQRSGRS